MSKMAISADVTLAENGAKLVHPYVADLMRWCVSWIWSTATVILNRVLTAPTKPSITASRPPPSRAASTGHIHPEPLVQCQVLHDPRTRDVDFIFVHGLYGSLENTWRQGDWRSKYKLQPSRISLRRPSSIPDACNSSKCVCNSTKPYTQTNSNFCICATNVEMKPQDDVENFDTKDFSEGFVGLDEINIINNYEMQANFVKKLFDCEANNCSFSDIIESKDLQRDNEEYISVSYEESTMDQMDNNRYEIDTNNEIYSKEYTIEYEHFSNDKEMEKNAEENIDLDFTKAFDSIKDPELEENLGKFCEIGCGCICDKCYSSCWPKDWLSVDFPNARIISINYTSDPHLWRPIWVKECKRLRLHERAEQMTSQLLELGVGEKPVVWVGHSKGGLFIKQIYAEAYEAYLKTQEENCDQNCIDSKQDNAINQQLETITRSAIDVDIDLQVSDENTPSVLIEDGLNVNNELINKYSSTMNTDSLVNNEQNTEKDMNAETSLEKRSTKGLIEKESYTIDRIDNLTSIHLRDSFNEENIKTDNVESIEDNQFEIKNYNTDTANENINLENKTIVDEQNSSNENNTEIDDLEPTEVTNGPNKDISREEMQRLQRVASLWSNSAGFMFYSVPHRGSALADIKTPITARSVELLEISKDCSLVLTLQQRWLAAARPRRPAVRSLVETNRTLMAVLWLRIVSVESADAGVGALCGVPVDHREICKPSSRRCVLYTELLRLAHAGLDGTRRDSDTEFSSTDVEETT